MRILTLGLRALAVLLAAPLAWVAPASANLPLVLDDSRDVYSLEGYLEVLEEPGPEWTIEDVTSPEISGLFEPYGEGEFDVGPGSFWWIRFRVRDEARRPKAWRLDVGSNSIQVIEFFRPRNAPGMAPEFDAFRTGFVRSLATREIRHNEFIFRLDMPPGTDEAYFYLRLRDRTRLNAPLRIVSLEAFSREDRLKDLEQGALAGILLVMLAYNLVLSVTLRSRSYLYYSIFLLSLFFFTFSYSGLLQVYLLPPELAWTYEIVAVSLELTLVFALVFTHRFLRLAQQAPRIARLVEALVVCNLITAVVLLFTLPAVALLVMLTSCVTMLIAGILVARRGQSSAKVFTIAWATFLSSLTGIALSELELIPWVGFFASTHSLGIGLLVVLLALALAARILGLQREKIATQAALVREQEESLRVKEELNTSLRNSQIELRTRNEELESFAYAFSHDLKNPLVTVKGFVGILKQDLAAGRSESLQRDISEIDRAATEVSRLLDGLLALSRGRRLGAVQEVVMAEVVETVVARLRTRIEQLGAVLEVATGLPSAHGDQERLAEAWYHLLDNALNAVRGETEPSVEIGFRDDGDGSVYYVRDNGIGIDPRYHQKVFGLFDRLDSKSEGTGVGLALVKQTVEMHGGSIWVESPGRGAGCTFCFQLSPHSVTHRSTST